MGAKKKNIKEDKEEEGVKGWKACDGNRYLYFNKLRLNSLHLIRVVHKASSYNTGLNW